MDRLEADARLVGGRTLTPAAFALALSAGATWAIGMTLAKPALRHTDPVSYVRLRWVVVGLLGVVFGLATRGFRFPGWPPVGYALLAGFLDAAAGGLFYVLAIERSSAHETTTLSSTVPIWGVAASVLFLGEPARWSVFVAAGLVVAGAFLLVHQPRGQRHADLTGPALALVAGLLWGVAETVPSKIALEQGMSPALLLVVFSVAAVASTSLAAPFLRPRIPRRMDRAGPGYIVASAAPGAFAGWVFWLLALERAPASLLSPVRGSTLLFAFAYSVVFLKERPRGTAFVGAALVFAGILAVSLLT